MMFGRVFVLFSFIAALTLDGAAIAQEAPERGIAIEFLLHEKVAASDGVPLAVTVWKPASDGDQFPTVLVATPYVSDESQARARVYAARGYAMASLDLRGRGASKGEYVPLSDHGDDICQAIAWIKAQPWSDGNVVMRGGSYRGMTQWMAARSCPKALKTMIPTASVYPGHDFPVFDGHRSQKYTATWLSFVTGPALNLNLFVDSEYWNEREATSYRENTPFHLYDDFAGAPSPHFLAWVETLSNPAIWAASQWNPDDYAKMNVPALTITGHYDGDQPGALRYYREHQAHAPIHVARDHYLVMGPWTHGGTRAPKRKLGQGVEFGPASVFDMNQFNLDWFDWRLGRGPKPELLIRRIAYYVGGAEEWRHADRLEDIAIEARVFYLSATPDEAYDVFRSGRLTTAPAIGEAPHIFKSDPLDTSPIDLSDTHWNEIRGGEFRATSPAYMPQTLVFHSASFAEEATLAGQMRAKLFLEMDTPDADIFVTVYAIFPNGEPLYLGGDVVRARFRDGFEPGLVEPGNVHAYEFENFFWNAWTLPAGTRLRFTIGPYNDPSAQKNYNSGGKLAFETSKDARVATIKLYHNSDYPSILEIPIASE